MIVVDIETSGRSKIKHGIVEIGAIKFEYPESVFHSYCRLDKDDEIDPKALEANGQSEEEVRNLNRPTQKQVLSRFFGWLKKQKDFYIAGENVGSFDLGFIEIRAEKYGLDFPIQHRTYDLHTLAESRYEKVYGEILFKNGKSEMGLPQILEFVGMKDERGKHSALEDCRLEAECISRLKFGRRLFLEYSKFKIPGYLKLK